MGVRRFFAWLETRAYKMHIRVLPLSRYRSYTECSARGGARLKARSAAVAHRQSRHQHPRRDADANRRQPALFRGARIAGAVG